MEVLQRPALVAFWGRLSCTPGYLRLELFMRKSPKAARKKLATSILWDGTTCLPSCLNRAQMFAPVAPDLYGKTREGDDNLLLAYLAAQKCQLKVTSRMALES